MNGRGDEGLEENEWYCSECGSRVTISPPEDDGDELNEYGHGPECAHRVAWRKDGDAR